MTTTTTFTALSFSAAIRRELKQREKAYPRIAQKAQKKGATPEEVIELTTKQRLQYELLEDALRAIEQGQQLLGGHADAVFQELHRELKCRKDYYGLLVWRKRITAEEAEYEKSVWKALIEHFEAHYIPDPEPLKAGKYRFIVQRTQEVLLTITDRDEFRKDFEAWDNMRGLGPDRAGEVTEYDFLRSRAIMINAGIYTSGVQKDVVLNHIYTEIQQTCRQCGCTDGTACQTDNGPCTWLADDLCSNPECVAKAAEEAEKEMGA